MNRICTSVTRKLAPNDSECAIIQCKIADDCCGGFVPPTYCPTYKADCTLDPTTYASECLTYAQFCVCAATQYKCDKGACTTACTLDTDCATNHCLNGSCVACVTEADCADATRTCSQNLCVPKCVSAGDCKAFEDCQGSVCVHVGCKTDRECLVSPSGSDPGLGFCDTASQPTHECAQHCGTDVDCAGLDPVTKTLQVCVGGRCVSAGCDDADECKVLLGDPLLTGSSYVDCVARSH